MEELLKEVFIKELHESGIDRVFYVQNLPKRFIFMKVPKVVQRYDRDGYTDGTMVPDPSGEKTDGLLDGLEFSQSGDEAVVFPMGKESAKLALRAIDAYISGTFPRDIVLPTRVDYPLDRTNSLSTPKSRNLIPTVELPLPRVEQPSQVSPVANAAPEKATRRSLTHEQKQAARERMARAREIKKQQIANKASAPSA